MEIKWRDAWEKALVTFGEVFDSTWETTVEEKKEISIYSLGI